MSGSASKVAQDIEQLAARHRDLDKKKTVAETNLKSANERLEELKRQAKEAYGTDDLEQLRAKLETMKQENERRRREYQQHLDEIESKLSEIENQYAAARQAGT